MSASDEVWADEGGMSLRVTTVDPGHVRVEVKAGISGPVIAGVTLGRWRWDRLVKAMENLPSPHGGQPITWADHDRIAEGGA